MSENLDKLAFEALQDERYQDAIQLLEQSARNRSPYAMRTLGWMHEVGKGVSVDKMKAIKYFQASVDAGSTHSNYDLGRLLMEQGDTQGALLVFRSGAATGNVGSMFALGRTLYESGQSESQKHEGIYWLKNSADMGHVYAKRKLLIIDLHKDTKIFRKVHTLLRFIPLIFGSFIQYLTNKHSEKLW